MDDEINTWFTSHGRVISAETIEDRTSVVGGPLIRYTFEDGAVLTIRPPKYENGEMTRPQEIVGRELPKPKEQSGKPSGSTTTFEGTPDPSKPGGFDNERPRKVTRGPNGELISADPLSPTEMDEWRESRERSRNPGGKTDKELRDEAAAAARNADANQPQPISAPPTQPYIVERLPDGQIRTTKNPNYQGEAPKPGASIQTRGGDGYLYIVPIDANGTPGQARRVEGVPPEQPAPKPVQPSQILNTDNGPVEVIRDPQTGQIIGTRPVPGTQQRPTTGGPTMPQIVLGQSEAAVRAAYEQARNDPNMTPAQRQAFVNSVIQTAQLTIQEANVFQSQRNSDITLATTKLNEMRSGLKDALTFVVGLNGKLPPGSDLGAKAFVAMLNLQMSMAQRSGLYDIPMSPQSRPGGPAYQQGQPGAKPGPNGGASEPPPRLPSVTDERAVEQARQESARELEQSPLLGPPIPPEPAPVQQTAPSPPSQPPVAPLPPAQSAQQPMPPAAPPAAPQQQPRPVAPPEPPRDPNLADPQTDPNLVPPMVNPVTGEPTGLPVAPVQMAPRLPPMTEQSPMPSFDIPALARYRPQPFEQASMGVAAPPTDFGMPVALLRQQVLSRPPWAISQAEHDEWLAAGVSEDDMLAIPGRRSGGIV